MQILGTVVSIQIDVPIKRKSGAPYQGFRLIYTDRDGAVKTEEKHMNTIKYDKALGKVLGELQAGDEITVVKEKEGDFWNIKSITKGWNSAPPQQIAPKDNPAPKASYTGTTGGRDFETKEERAAKQLYIIRQSSLAQAIQLKPKESKEGIVQLAEFFTDWVLNGTAHSETASSSQEAQEDFQDDIPY